MLVIRHIDGNAINTIALNIRMDSNVQSIIIDKQLI